RKPRANLSDQKTTPTKRRRQGGVKTREGSGCWPGASASLRWFGGRAGGRQRLRVIRQVAQIVDNVCSLLIVLDADKGHLGALREGRRLVQPFIQRVEGPVAAL